MDTSATNPRSPATDDPLLRRLERRYENQRSEQLAGKNKKLEKVLNIGALRDHALPPSVELLSDETARVFNELEAGIAAMGPAARATAEKLRRVRSLVNQELRQAMGYLEEGYTSAFRTLLTEVQLAKAGGSGSSAAAGLAPPTLISSTTTTTPTPTMPASPSIPATEATAPVEAGTEGWPKATRAAVAQEAVHQAAHRVDRLPRRFNVREALSSVTALFAESLATLLFCEVVRVYLYDESGSLHCCACFPSTATAGDPMRATYREVMLAKELHASVCNKGLAVNGGEAQYPPIFSARDMESIRAEAEESGWGSISSCLIFPIPFHKGGGRTGGGRQLKLSAGMIHAVNKMPSSSSQPGRFTADDEVLMSMCARTLGCMLTRYPVHYFTLRMDAAIRAAAHPNEGPLARDGHLPEIMRDDVADATLMGIKAMLAPQPLVILRAPVSDIYQTRTQLARNRKMRSLVANDTALSTVEFNLSAVMELWQSGMEDNVVMHKQYRSLNEQNLHAKLLMRNLLDGLAATRTMRDPVDMARYLQTLEMLTRSESIEKLAEFVANTIIGGTRTLVTPPRSQQSNLDYVLGVRSARTAAGQRSGWESEGEREREGEGETVPRQRHNGDFADSLSSRPATVDTMTAHPSSAAPSVTPPPAPSGAAPSDPFLDYRETIELLRTHERTNAVAAARIHVDGPDGVRAYSSDPHSKREQMRFIADTQRRRVAEQRTLLRAELSAQSASADESPPLAAGASPGPDSSQPRAVVVPRNPKPAALPKRVAAAPTLGNRSRGRYQL